jgi:stage II sporulation protein D (peptidoglycan lytic transglycosylase)
VRIWAPFLLLLLADPSVLLSQDVQVRIYSAHPPSSLAVLAIEGHLHWKSCPTCQEQTGQQLSVEAATMNTSAPGKAAPTEFLITGVYRLQPPNGPTFSSPFPLRIETPPGGLVVIVTMPMEPYVQHVLMAESSVFQNAEALKAMAVAARSYANKFTGQHSREGFDFCDTTHCQVFYWRSITERIRMATEATRGEYVSYQGKAAATFYHQNCGGTTAAASETWAQVSEPYLSVHSDNYCLTSGSLHWETTLSHEQIDRALSKSGLQPPQNWQALEISSRNSSGRVSKVNLSGGKPASFLLSGSSLRFALDRVLGWNKIRSDLYELRNSGGKVMFSGRGAGHGVGLCQAGAEEMAREGKTYKEILSFYYPGTQVAKSENETWQKRSDERFDLISVDPGADSSIFPVAEHVLSGAESNVGWRVPFRVRLQVFSSLDSYRNTTGQPGWVAASTRGQTIRLQPLTDLRRRSILESTLRHELYHLLVEARASRKTPLWFREGLTLYLASPAVPDAPLSSLSVGEIEEILKHGDTRENTERAYVSAHRIVADLVQRYGKQTALGWLSRGLPADVLRAPGEVPALTPRNGAGEQPSEKPQQIRREASKDQAYRFASESRGAKIRRPSHDFLCRQHSQEGRENHNAPIRKVSHGFPPRCESLSPKTSKARTRSAGEKGKDQTWNQNPP